MTSIRNPGSAGEAETVTVEHALEVCSLFASTEPNNRGVEHVCVRSTQVEGTNGHVLLMLPIERQDWLTGRRLVPRDRALLDGRAGVDVAQLLMGLPEDGGPFPDTDKFVADLAGHVPSFSCLVNPFYLELIGKAFGMLGVGKVRLVCRGEFLALEFIGQQPGGSLGRAFVMPMK